MTTEKKNELHEEPNSSLENTTADSENQTAETAIKSPSPDKTSNEEASARINPDIEITKHEENLSVIPEQNVQVPDEPATEMVSEQKEIKDEQEKAEETKDTVAKPEEEKKQADTLKDAVAESGTEEVGISKISEDVKNEGEEESKEVKDENEVPEDEESEEVQVDDGGVKEVDYSSYSMEDLVSSLNILVHDRPVQSIKNDLEQIKSNFYKKLKLALIKKKEAFLNDGGKDEDFAPVADPLEEKLKDLLNLYKREKSAYNHQIELEKQANLEEKYRIIENIKGLINKEESINKTFQEFRDLQHRWKSIGMVPQAKLKDLWENYHYHVEKFYDYIKINKELRDLDLRKNLESKMALCEKAEKLLEESNVVSAFRTLQKYHEQWREIGPVPHESKEIIWERFRSLTSLINKKHQKHFEDIKASLKKNLELKTALCEKVEAILQEEINSNRDWEKKSNEIVEIQKEWKTIGFAPKKHNTLIYERFRKVCDDFFNKRRAFYAENKEIQQHNLQLKTELCEKAEEVLTSEDWRRTTDYLIDLQKKWKEIGPVPRRYSDKIWKRFRSACDTFFNRKSEYFSNIDQKYDENLKLKKELLEKIRSFEKSDNLDDNFARLKEFQHQWSEIGFVPIKKKDEIMQQYRQAVDHFYDSLKLDEARKSLLRYKNKLEDMDTAPNFRRKLYAEREKFINRLKTLESDIVTWENNIGFFAKSASSNPMIEEVTRKIENAKKNLKILKEKIKMIDDII